MIGYAAQSQSFGNRCWFNYIIFAQNAYLRLRRFKAYIHAYSPSEYASTRPVATALRGPSTPRILARPATILNLDS